MDALALSPLEPPDFLKMLAHDLRWKIVTALTQSDRRGLELVSLLGEPQNLVSYHLRRLRETQLVNERRSSADARDIYYSLNLDHLRELYFSTGNALHPTLSFALPRNSTSDRKEDEIANKELRPTRVLFLCTHNSARSQMAEGIMRHLGGDSVEVFSAGSQPSSVHPDAVSAMSSMDIDIHSQRSKHKDEFSHETFDYIVTVCDRVRETCPAFPNDPKQIHWSFPDPAVVEPRDERLQAFKTIALELSTRVRYLMMQIEKARRERGGERER